MAAAAPAAAGVGAAAMDVSEAAGSTAPARRHHVFDVVDHDDGHPRRRGSVAGGSDGGGLA